MRTILLGAGASKAYGESPSGVRMPLAKDFFSTFNQLKISENPWVLFHYLYGYIKDTKHKEPYKYLNSGIDIEELYSEIEEFLLREPKTANSVEYFMTRAASTQLVFIFATVINEIQNGPIASVQKRIANCLADSDIIITFNWDTLMDRALHESKGWSVDSGYGITPRAIFRNGWVEPKSNNECRVKLLKLHGSTNWITGYPLNLRGGISLGHALDPSSVFIYEYTVDPFDTYAGRYMAGYEPFSFGYYPPNLTDVPGVSAGEGYSFVQFHQHFPWSPRGESGDRGIPSMPLIIPPVKQKNYSLFGSLFGKLWSDAEIALIDSRHIIIIGYSFPRTDLRSNKLFIDAFLKRENIPLITIVDPYPERVVDKFRVEFGIPDTHIRVFKDYLSLDFDIESLINEA